MIRDGRKEGQGRLKPPGDLRHPLQRQMQDRMDWMLSMIKGTGKMGMEEEEIERTMLVNYGVSVRLTKQYLSTLHQFGRLRKEGLAYVCTEEEG